MTTSSFQDRVAPPGTATAGWTAALTASAASGLALGVLFPRFGWDWLAWVALVPLFIVIARARGAWQAFWGGYLAGFLFFALSCPWIATTIHHYGDLSRPIAAVVFVLFLLLMGSYLGLFAVLGYWLGNSLGHRLVPLPFLWVAVEWFRTYTPMGGFPWNLLGYSQYQHAGFMLVVPWTGIYGASLLIALANTCVAALLLHRARRTASLALPAIGLVLILGFATLPYHPPAALPRPLRARLVQPNTALGLNWTSSTLNTFLQTQERLSTPPGTPPVNLILWPEQPAPLNFELQPQFQRMSARLLDATHAAFLFEEVSYPLSALGVPNYHQPRNSAQLINADGTIGPRYDKMHLVPFGEYDPLPAWIASLGGVGKLVQDVSDFVPGSAPALLPLGPHRFAVMICYESIFPALARHNVAQGAEFLVNLSDDSWYGNSSAAPQGLMMAQVRAMENRRWLLRDTDNGITAVIDPYGRVTAYLPRFTSGVLDASFAPSSALTFYTRHGDWLAFACLLAAAALALYGLGRSLWKKKNHQRLNP